MSARHLPLLIENRLLTTPDDGEPAILAGEPAWFAWLAQPEHSSFSYQNAGAAITVRRERRRNGWYWYAYRAVNGKLRKVYLGTAQHLTAERLRDLTAPLIQEAAPTEQPADIRLTFFGAPRILADGHPVHLTSGKALLLLAYLCAHDRPQHRDHLLALMWPESGEAQARKNLRNALWAIRTAVGRDVITGDAALALNERVQSDVRACEQAYAEAARRETSGEDGTTCYEKVTTLCQSRFLDGISLSESEELETWLDLTRERFYELRLRALRALALAHRTAGNWAEVITVAHAAIIQDPLQEPMYRALMEAHACLGDRVAALRQYDTLRALLERELGVGPLPETEQLRADILQGAIPATQLSGEPTTPASPIPPPSDRSPFVGREQEIAALDAVWAMVGAGSARVALVSGEAGVGKSRLWQMWSSRLGPGVTLLSTRCLPTTQGLPFAPLAELLRGDAVWRRLARIAQASAPAWLDDVLQLVPDMREKLPARTQPPALPAIEERRRMFEALIHGLGFTPDRRIALFIDDLHWADQATIEWLGYLMHRGQELPFLLVIAYRQEDAPPSLLKQITYWSHEGIAQRLSLVRLSRDESLQLISALQGDPRRAESVYQQSAGNPYFLIELLRATPGVMPIALTDLIALRLDQLPSVARQVLQVAAILQPEIDLAMLRTISGRTEEETLDALDTLTWTGLLQERQGMYEFGHPLIALVVENELSRARSSILHRRVAETLERLGAGHLADVSGRLARHFRAAGATEHAARYAEMAGDRSLALAAPVEAANFYEQAIELFPTPSRWFGLGLARRLQANLEGARNAFTHALTLCERTGKRTIAARICLELGRICLANNQFEEIVTWVHRARAYQHFASDPLLVQALAAYLMGGHLRGTGQSLHDAVVYLNDALLNAIKGNMLELQPGILLELGTVIGYQGDLSGAIRCFNEMIALANTIGDYFHEALGYNGLANQALAVGDITMASRALGDGLALARGHRVRLVYPWLYITHGKLALAEQHWQEADSWLKRAAAEAERFGAVAQVATCNAYLGLAALGRQRLSDAARLLEAARIQASLGSETYFQIEVLLSLTSLYCQQGDRDLAAARFHEAQTKLAQVEYLLLHQQAAHLREQVAGD